MSFIYGCKYKAPESPLLDALRRELIPGEYKDVDWGAARNNICPDDLYTPHTKLLDMFFGLTNVYEKVHSTTLRQWHGALSPP